MRKPGTDPSDPCVYQGWFQSHDASGQCDFGSYSETSIPYIAYATGDSAVDWGK